MVRGRNVITYVHTNTHTCKHTHTYIPVAFIDKPSQGDQRLLADSHALERNVIRVDNLYERGLDREERGVGEGATLRFERGC